MSKRLKKNILSISGYFYLTRDIKQMSNSYIVQGISLVYDLSVPSFSAKTISRIFTVTKRKNSEGDIQK